MLKYTNVEKTSAKFGGESFSIFPAENWKSIGNTPTRDAVLAWLVEGNSPEPADSIPQPVISVTPWQIRKAMNSLGLRAAVESAVASADQATKDGWEFAQEFRRDNPLIASVAVAIGKTGAEIDALFVLAVTL